jgi:hypothetical protein
VASAPLWDCGSGRERQAHRDNDLELRPIDGFLAAAPKDALEAEIFAPEKGIA